MKPSRSRAKPSRGNTNCTYSGGGDLELMHPCRDGAGQAARITHRPMGHISDTSVHQLVTGWLKGTLLERAQVLTHASGLAKSLWGCIKCSGTTAPLEGEQNIIHILSVHSKQPAAPHFSSSPPPTTPSSMPADTAPSMLVQANVPGELPEHLCHSAPPILSCPVRDIQTVEGTAAPSHAHGSSQMPGPLVEAGGAWAVKHSANAPAPLEDPEGNKLVLEAETSDVEAAEPHMLVEAKQLTDWPLRAKEIKEPSTLKATGTWRSEVSPRTNNGTLDISRVLCMQHLPGHKSPEAGTHTLYSSKMPNALKQPAHCPSQEFTSIFTFPSLKQHAADAAATLKLGTSKGNPMMIAVHADDHTVVPTLLCLADSLKATGLSWPHCTQGIEIKLDPEAHITHFSQHTYIDATLYHLHLDKLKPLNLTDNMATVTLMTALHSAKVKHFTTSQDCAQNEGECCRMQSWTTDRHA
jgi:hypothetical protein